jgi:hypothetical protein
MRTRWHSDNLWLLNSGTGGLGFNVGLRFQPVTHCRGFVRELVLLGCCAVVGLSKCDVMVVTRAPSYASLTLEVTFPKGLSPPVMAAPPDHAARPRARSA